MMAQAGGMDVNALLQRLRRLATLDTSVFDEVKSDPASTLPAVVVFAASVVIFSLGGWLWWAFTISGTSTGRAFFETVVIGSILAIVIWAISVGVIYVVLTQVLHAHADIYELVRVTGFASVPLVLGVLTFIPHLEMAMGVTSLALFFGANLIAVQCATDAPVGKVFLAVAAGFLLWAIVVPIFVSTSHAYAPGFFSFDRWFEVARSVSNVYRGGF